MSSFSTREGVPIPLRESLVPGVIPILRKLDIEERVAAISVLKPGVSFYPGGGDVTSVI